MLINSTNERSRVKLTKGKTASSHKLNELKAKNLIYASGNRYSQRNDGSTKKDLSINMAPLSKVEKAEIADALNIKYPLPILLKKLRIAKSSYYYLYALQKSTKMIAKLLRPYFAIIKKDMDTVELKLF